MRDSLREYTAWLENPRLDAELRRELEKIKNQPEEIEERFYTELAFGTAGLRGMLGAGTNRMNVHVVRRATQGLANYLLLHEGAKERGVAIAYDSRNKSKDFALQTALVLAANGIKAYLYRTLHSVPQLSFAVLHLNAIAGVVITASHNPPSYNGYKVYWQDGGQVGPEQAEEILRHIRQAGYFDAEPMAEEQALSGGRLVYIGEEVDEAYYACTSSLLLHSALLKEKGGDIRLVYTPLHGTGYVPVTTLLKRAGIENISVVEEQAQPDGNFPTVKSPNPEDPGAFKLAFALADRVGADAIFASDPDADRLGAAVHRPDGTFEVLTGNQIGSILTHYILSSKKEAGTLPKNALVVKSIVSTRMVDAICARFGVTVQDVLTGFRFIAQAIERSRETGEHEFVFGFEESYGFLAGSFVRDKDAICAALLLAEACVYYKETFGKTLYDVLRDMYKAYGYFKESVRSYTLEGKAGIARIESAMQKLRAHPPEAFSGIKVTAVEDVLSGKRYTIDDERTEKIALPPSDVLRYFLEGDAWVCIRPSGTEPKLKLYIGASAPREQELDALLERLTADADRLIRENLEEI